MELSLSNLLMDSLEDISLDLNTIKKEELNSVSEYTKFAHFLLIRDNLDGIADRKVSTGDLMKDNFLPNFIEALSNAASNTNSSDEYINSISTSIKSLINNASLTNEIGCAKTELSNSELSTNSLW